jgi:RNA polymerase sigma-70 factor (ECF subfamily)
VLRKGDGQGVLEANPLCCRAWMIQSAEGAWLADFHAGHRVVLEQCYRAQYGKVMRAVGRMLTRADAETVTHEVFYRLLSSARLRESFQGGSLDAWLAQVATNTARDLLRRQRREQPEEAAGDARASRANTNCEGAEGGTFADEVDAKLLIERFRAERLPPEWRGVFDARFLRQLPQRRAAAELGIPRTTLVYQEQRIRALLRDFVLRGGEP